MKKLWLIAVVLFCAISAAGTEIRSYDVMVHVADGGTANGVATISLADARPGVIAIPLGFNAKNIRLNAGPAGTTMSSEPFNGQTRVRINLPSPVAGEVRIQLSFDVHGALYLPEAPAGQRRVLPEGAWMLQHTLVATEAVTIRRYRCEVTFPDELRAHTIREALPPLGKKEAEPRVLLASIDGTPGARLQTGPLFQGDRASMQIELVPRSHSPLWIACGVLLSLMYLVSFRNLVFGPGDSAPQDTDDDEELS